MANTSDIRNGLCIRHSNDIYSVVEFQHVKPGKGPAFVRTKLKSLTTGKVVDNTFPAGHKIDVVRVERRKYQFLYNDDFGFHFMNNETYEQATISEKLIDNPKFLKEGNQVDILFNSEDEIIKKIEAGTPIGTTSIPCVRNHLYRTWCKRGYCNQYIKTCQNRNWCRNQSSAIYQ